MDKLKLKGISSEEYPDGRLDSFVVPLLKGINHSKIIPLFMDLGLSNEDALQKLDLDFENKALYPAGTSFFIYVSKELKAYLIIGEENLYINLDTALPRDKIVTIIEKYFQFP
ncbi:hypothetical protein A3K73_06240 [Candidatus Pacearchaeota archaeon RBG_13_36_9]|nr:MAG: hypothetical protein A3K73_06240 [Candidatus Pacearchaeota archaeon RBG_13_36_9]